MFFHTYFILYLIFISSTKFQSNIQTKPGFSPARFHIASSQERALAASIGVLIENGKYYLTGTRNQEPQGFAILESTDLEHWTVPDDTSLQLILRKGDQTYGEKGFWAPQYFKDKRTYYFTYTANEQTVIASSKSVFGPFRQKEVKPIDASAKNIDSFLFKDDDGKYYLYHVRFNKGNYLWVAEFDIKKGSIKPETLKQCMDCTILGKRLRTISLHR